jgi:hypothetical protein
MQDRREQMRAKYPFIAQVMDDLRKHLPPNEGGRSDHKVIRIWDVQTGKTIVERKNA